MASSIVVKASGGDFAVTLASLANAAARQSAKIDLGSDWSREYAITVELESGGSAPTAGAAVDLYAAFSPSGTAGTQNPGGCSGADAAYQAGNEAAFVKQLTYIGSLVATASASTVQRATFRIVPASRYLCLVVHNNWGQSLETNDDEHKITFTPIEDRYTAA